MFEIGDTVKIKDDFTKIRRIPDVGINSDMERLAGKESTIASVSQGLTRNIYTLNDYGWSWEEFWLEPVYMTEIQSMNENEIMNLFGE